ncbi:hypothetical protein JHK86_028223 [Glycine max]|nr:hypothetical protein JHK86_028223 [Glycine max]
MDVENGEERKHDDASTSENRAETSTNGEKEEKSKQQEKPETVPFHKLFAFADSTDILLMAVGTIGAIGNGLGLPLMTLLFGQMIDSFGSNQRNTNVVEEVSKVSLKFVYLAVGSGLAAFLQVTSWMVTGERQAARIRGLYLKTILRQDVAFFDKETNTGEVIGRMSGDTVLIQDAMGEKVGKFLQLIATFIGGFVIAFIKGWLLTVVMLSTLPLLALSGATMAVIIGRMASRGQTAYAKAAHVVEQTIGSIRTVASFTGEKQAVSSYSKFLVDAYKSGVHEGFIAGAGLGTVMLVIFCGYALAVWFGAKMIMEKGYNGGTVINVIIAVLTASMSLGEASPSLSAFAAGQAAAYKMFQTIERKPEIDAYDPNGKILEDIQGEIELRDVYFSYPARPEELIFNGFSLHIPSGTTAALVGQSGSGKSTVISLVERFYDPQAGEVLIDGINLKEFQLSFYLCMQGLDTMVCEHGTQLSGGQKQRIAIARAILKNPRILLLDEATSALDAESERVVQEALDRIMVNRTTIVVAHRLSTVRNADMIAVIHRGKMVEKGTHSELLKDPEGAYSQLIRLQEVSKETEGNADQHDKTELSVESFRQSSQKRSLQRSISRGSSLGNSSRHSFSVSFGLPTGVNVADPELENSQPKEEAPEVPLSRLASLNKPEIPVIVIGSVAAIANGVIFPIFGVLISSVIKTFYEPFDEMKKDSEFWALMFMILGLASFLIIPARGYFFSVAGCKLIQRIRLMCFEKVVNMEVSWFDEPENSSGAIGARLSADAASVRALVGDALGLLVQNFATALAGLIIAFVASWQLALIILVLIPLIGVNGYVQMKFMKGFSADAKMMYEEASQVANDAVGSIRTVASFCAEDKVMELYKKKCEGPMKTGIRQGLISGSGFGVSFFLLFCVYATSFYAGARLMDSGKTTFSDVFQVFFALTMAAIGVSQSSSFAPDSSKAKSATASIFGIIDKKSKIDSSDASGSTLDSIKGEIELRHVSFKYPSRPDMQIFRDLRLTIHSGKTVALVGESGSGKSTVIALLQRFYDPDSGQITLDGGYDTIVGERGTQLSGGQKQRVAIARAIIKSPKILLLDEATSALDAESERVVQDALDKVMVNRTTVVVAHRLSTIKNADVIAVVKNGVIVEKGKHEKLINLSDGFYASLVQLHTSASTV